MQFFYFRFLFFSTLEDFSEKTYEKTYRFYNIFPKFIPNCTCLPSFTFFSKILWRFQYNIHFFPFLVVLRYPLFSIFCSFKRKFMKRHTNFMTYFQSCYDYVQGHKICDLKIFTKKWRLFQNVHNFLFISTTLSNICDKTYEKTYSFFYIFWKFHFIFTSLQNFVIEIFF